MANDERVARNAAAHRGLHYQSRLAPEQDRRRKGPAVSLNWSANLAYAVGLIATDGCLSSDGRHIIFVSTDRELVATLLACIDRGRLKIAATRTKLGRAVFRCQIGDVALYRWLTAIGLTPRKSLTLGALDVPEELMPHTIRGLLDGDGTITHFVHAPTPRTNPEYRYERLMVRFCSASRTHVNWLRASIERLFGVAGSLAQARSPLSGNYLYTLNYGKHATIAILGELYADQLAPCLPRKRAIWDAYGPSSRIE